ncbi:hypothetical protein TthWC1_0434 [Thermoanaerobacter thermohydrosulfuricus WC1]|uniref:Uncharacterized protein n=1 Tax=Thermoanaerobacter thermohydrosulfuricus WC1 TaxID=1198630 RepID=M8CS41_THETY|nr:SIR2 family protein [Thermoanaerobacter thermohydrosulfuricus]EMT40010.1 hypothetical protein TthWC1_0434 [Thermoanaerobacter thermohydrosulfuricus WC1]
MIQEKKEEVEVQILKCWDDKEPVCFTKVTNDDKDKNGEEFKSLTDSSWIKKREKFGEEKLRERIAPWLSTLFKAEHLSLLIGSGLTNAVCNIAKCEVPSWKNIKFEWITEEIKEKIEKEAQKSAYRAGRGEANLEDRIRVTNELIRGLEIYYGSDNKELIDLKSALNEVLEKIAKLILDTEIEFRKSDKDVQKNALNYLVNFLMSFASRPGTRERLHIFTTNYDRFIELGADIAGLRLIDRFIGTLSPIFRSSRLEVDMHYNPPGIRGEPRYLEGVAYFTKLHGSLDWFNINRTIHRISIPFGAKSIQPYLDAVGIDDNQSDTIKQLMIYPNAAKDRETAEYPYVELFRDFAASICRPNTTLVTYGYSFGDEHINRIIEDMLTIPSTHLIIISRDDSTGRIMSLYDRLGRKQQITILIGDQLADLQLLVDNYLPKSTIDFTTFKIDELIKKILITNSDNIGSNVNSEKETRIEQDEEYKNEGGEENELHTI